MGSLFTRENLFHLVKELIWTIITLMVCYAVIYPITLKIDYIYYKINYAFIFVVLTYFRWTFTFKKLPFLRPLWVRFLLFTINISMFVYFVQQEQKFMMFVDSFYTEDFGFPKVIMFDHVKEQLFKYLYGEIVFFSTGSLIMIFIFNLRLMLAWWQFYTRKANRLLE